MLNLGIFALMDSFQVGIFCFVLELIDLGVIAVFFISLFCLPSSSLINFIQDGRCNFYKRSNQPPKLSDF